MKANILHNNSKKPKHKANRVNSKNDWDRRKDLAAAKMCYFQK